MRKFTGLLFRCFLYSVIVVMFAASSIPVNNSTFTDLDKAGLFSEISSLENFTVVVRVWGNISNEGSEPLYLNETDILVFEYPLNTGDQRVYSVKAWVNDAEYDYVLVNESGNTYLVINYPEANTSLDPGESISVGVEYVVGINRTKRIYSVLDFQIVDDPYKLLDKAGNWTDLVEANTTMGNYTSITGLWNYTHPLIRLVYKYIERKLVANNPLGYLLGVLEWISESIIYSTRVPARHPWETIIEGSGDCDDQSNLLITLLRASGIPSYLEIGFVYIHENYYFKDEEANGYYIYEFRGGGGHGWVVAYIPPWGWIRVDPVVGSLGPLPRVAIKYALYYIKPTIVAERIVREDYVIETARAVETIESRKIKMHLVIEMHSLSETTQSPQYTS
ncbi:MAG: transglutaminase-like domain-containing protein [Thermoprotei archaeon]